MRLLIICVATLLLGRAQIHAEQWKLQYFYDEDRSALNINDLKCPSAQRCVAAGFISEKKDVRPAAVVTGDGGAHWARVPLKETGISLFFLDENLGWMVGTRSLWKTQEAGRSWQRVGKLPAGIIRVWFLDAMLGFAVGGRKSVYQTANGGLKWTAVAAAAQPKTNPEYTAYTWIDFADQTTGFIGGHSRPPRRDQGRLPDWLEPEKAVNRKQWPTLSITLDTHDGGKTWKPSTASLFGEITRVRLLPDGSGLGLVSFEDSFQVPSEVFRIDWKNGQSQRVYREKDRKITDALLVSRNLAYIAGRQVVGKFYQNPIPSRLTILRSDDLTNWKEMDVDYRATAVRAVLAAADPRDVWVATDTGMILKLVP